MKFTASATAQGYAFTDNKTLVTSSATATGLSNVSYEEALVQATELAQEEANLIAIYDANLINQSVTETLTITTEKMNYNMMQINSPPDLTFYYSNLKKYTDVYQTNIGNLGLNQYTNSSLYSDIELTNKIGIRTCESIIYTNPSYSEPNYSSTLKYYMLPKGTLFVSAGPSYTIQNIEGTFVSPDGIKLRQIVSGSGEYLNKTGLIEEIINNETSIRTMNIYLNNY